MGLQEHEILNNTFAQVARHLQGAWSWQPNQPDWTPGGVLVDVTGVALRARISERPGTYKVYPEVPRDSRGQVPYVASQNLPSINVGMGRSPEQIAREIERRLLPAWLPILQEALEAIERSNVHQSTGESVARAIAGIAGVKLGARGKDVSFYGSPHAVLDGGGARVSGDAVELTLRLASGDALTLLRYLVGK